MTKTKKGVDYSKVTPALVKQVKDVIADADKHTYSVSKVYAAHNAALGLREQPQTCSSCLRNRARDLRDWLKGYDDYAKANAPKPETPPAGNEGTDEGGKAQDGDQTGQSGDADTDPNNPQYDAPAPGVVRIPMKEGAPIDLTPASEDDQTKGTVTYADGTKVAPGKYTTARGETIVVQVGSKGRIEVEDLT